MVATPAPFVQPLAAFADRPRHHVFDLGRRWQTPQPEAAIRAGL
jgi:hypothetical protein